MNHILMNFINPVYLYPTHLIYQAMRKPNITTEPCFGICAMCGVKITNGVKLDNSISESFTNFDVLANRNASHVCKCCNACLKEPRLRRMNFVAIGKRKESDAYLIYFKRNDIGMWLFQYIPAPFIICITESMKKHTSFKARINLSSELFFVQKENELILFSPNKYRDSYEAMKRLYSLFTKKSIATGKYRVHLIKRYGLNNLRRDEAIIKDIRGTQQFNLLLFALNTNEEDTNGM